MTATILIVDDEDNFRNFTGAYLRGQGYEVLEAVNLSTARNFVNTGRADIILLDVRLGDEYGPDLLKETALMTPRPPVMIITAYGEIEMAVEAMKDGAHDFLEKPIQFERLLPSIQRAEEIVAMRRELAHIRQTQLKELDFIIGKNSIVQETFKRAERVAMAESPALITGQTGTGKDILAHYIHIIGPRSKKLFVHQNCSAIQSTVFESELFGYEPGAFTGAERRKLGMLEVADGGILFLDEISSMPLDIQPKLLVAVENQTFRRVGGTTQLKADVQIIAASNKDLPSLIKEGKFRDDLYYRLKVVNLDLPSLKERKEDIPDLVGLFIRQFNLKRGANIVDISPNAMQALIDYDWPGNIRELHHVIETATLFCDEAVIDIGHLPPDITRGY